MIAFGARNHLIAPITQKPRDDSEQALITRSAQSASRMRDFMSRSYLKPLQAEKPTLEVQREGQTARFFQAHRHLFTETPEGGLRTRRTDPETVLRMIDRVQERGLNTLRVQGKKAFRQSAWLYGAHRGMVVTGYQPSQNDQLTLALLKERMPHPAPGLEVTHSERDRTKAESSLKAPVLEPFQPKPLAWKDRSSDMSLVEKVQMCLKKGVGGTDDTRLVYTQEVHLAVLSLKAEDIAAVDHWVRDRPEHHAAWAVFRSEDVPANDPDALKHPRFGSDLLQFRDQDYPNLSDRLKPELAHDLVANHRADLIALPEQHKTPLRDALLGGLAFRDTKRLETAITVVRDLNTLERIGDHERAGTLPDLARLSGLSPSDAPDLTQQIDERLKTFDRAGLDRIERAVTHAFPGVHEGWFQARRRWQAQAPVHETYSPDPLQQKQAVDVVRDLEGLGWLHGQRDRDALPLRLDPELVTREIARLEHRALNNLAGLDEPTLVRVQEATATLTAVPKNPAFARAFAREEAAPPLRTTPIAPQRRPGGRG